MAARTRLRRDPKMSKTRPPDILRKSHRHVERKERARVKDELRHEVKELDGDELLADDESEREQPDDDQN